MYDPTIGKWISEDPIGFGGGDSNTSRYVGNQPTMFVDPNGLSTVLPTDWPWPGVDKGSLGPGAQPGFPDWWDIYNNGNGRPVDLADFPEAMERYRELAQEAIKNHMRNGLMPCAPKGSFAVPVDFTGEPGGVFGDRGLFPLGNGIISVSFEVFYPKRGGLYVKFHAFQIDAFKSPWNRFDNISFLEFDTGTPYAIYAAFSGDCRLPAPGRPATPARLSSPPTLDDLKDYPFHFPGPRPRTPHGNPSRGEFLP